MNDQRYSGSDDADIDLDTQELVKPVSEEPLGYGHGEWASDPVPSPQEREKTRTGIGDSDVEQRMRNAEAALDMLRATTSNLEREVAMIRADLERLRQESERAAGSRMP